MIQNCSGLSGSICPVVQSATLSANTIVRHTLRMVSIPGQKEESPTKYDQYRNVLGRKRGIDTPVLFLRGLRRADNTVLGCGPVSRRTSG